MGRFLGEGTCFLYAAMEISLIADFFKGLDRQGPGGDPQTRMALELAGNLLPDKIDALDIGCGTGRQTAVLASTIFRWSGVSVNSPASIAETVR